MSGGGPIGRKEFFLAVAADEESETQLYTATCRSSLNSTFQSPPLEPSVPSLLQVSISENSISEPPSSPK